MRNRFDIVTKWATRATALVMVIIGIIATDSLKNPIACWFFVILFIVLMKFNEGK